MYLEGIEMLQLLEMRVVSLYENVIDDGDLSYGGIVCLIVVLTLCREAKERARPERGRCNGSYDAYALFMAWTTCNLFSMCTRG